MSLPLLAMALGFAGLVLGADRFVAGAAGSAQRLGVSPLFVGLTVVALGTAAPEMLVSLVAAIGGNPGLGIGNALGSNLTNCTLVLGTAALASPLLFRGATIRRELPVLLGIIAGAWLLLAGGGFPRWAGVLLAAGTVPLLWWMYRLGQVSDAHAAAPAAAAPVRSLTQELWRFASGLVILLAGSRAVVWGALAIAQRLDVSDTVIGLSLVAVGTSLPELAASVTAARKGEHDIAIGNVLGSNMFNLLLVLGLAGAVAPGPLEPAVLARDFPAVLGVTVAVAALAFVRRGPPRLGRGAGALLLLAFVCYQLLLYD